MLENSSSFRSMDTEMDTVISPEATTIQGNCGSGQGFSCFLFHGLGHGAGSWPAEPMRLMMAWFTPAGSGLTTPGLGAGVGVGPSV